MKYEFIGVFKCSNGFRWTILAQNDDINAVWDDFINQRDEFLTSIENSTLFEQRGFTVNIEVYVNGKYSHTSQYYTHYVSYDMDFGPHMEWNCKFFDEMQEEG